MLGGRDLHAPVQPHPDQRSAHRREPHRATAENGDRRATTTPPSGASQAPPATPTWSAFPGFTVTDSWQPSATPPTCPSIFTVNNYQWADTLTWVKARHLIKFGGDILRTQFFQPYYNNNRGTFAFNGFWTSVPFADFMLGVLNQVTRTVGSNPNYLFFTNYGFFAQDDFRITPSLTLNLGLRYEIPTAAARRSTGA